MIEVPPTIEPVAVPGSRVKVSMGAGNLKYLGSIARDLGGCRALVVSDAGVLRAGHAERAMGALDQAGVAADLFSDVQENPTTDHVAAGAAFAAGRGIDLVIGIGGGSAMDCAKGIDFILTNGGTMLSYWGVNLAKNPLLPIIAIPTTAGTGSDAQSFALISDPQTHQKMACGDSGALPRVAILDSDLTLSQPPRVAAAAGIDALTHGVESSASTRRNEISRELSRTAWQLLNSSFQTAMENPADAANRQRMLLGAHLAGAAIENSMLGAAHSLANALTAYFGVVHGAAVGIMLPHVIRFNAAGGGNPYADLDADAGRLADRMETLLRIARLPTRLGEYGIEAEALPRLAAFAATQWTAKFNPRPVDQADFSAILRNAL